MIIIGEKLNSSIPSVQQFMLEKNDDAILSIIRRQQDCGANYLDVNTAVCSGAELETMLWITDKIAEHTDCGIMLDSPETEIILKALEIIKANGKYNNTPIIINSVTLTDRFDRLAPAAYQYGCGLVGLPMDGDGIPASVEYRVKNAELLIERMQRIGIRPENIYIDAIVETMSVDSENAGITLKTIREIRVRRADIHITCGLSNISFGLPKRVNLNAAFLNAAVFEGLDSAIMDITSTAMRNALYASLAISGKDEFCLEYINYIRENAL